MTARFVAETEGTKARIAATRKTTPGLRALEKVAVVHGGGLPHRFGLFDAAMIKDNHALAAGGVAAAVAAVRGALGHVHGLEVEVDESRNWTRPSPPAPSVVLLDNMDLEQVRAAVAARRRPRRRRGLGRRHAGARARPRGDRGRRALVRRAHDAQPLD